jgi:polyhydroxyalkanoate synthesis regulator protein
MGAVVKAQAQLREAARQVLRKGTVNKKAEKLFTEIRTRNTVLCDIQNETYERWAMNGFQVIEKESTDKAKANARHIQYAQNKNQRHGGNAND